MIDELVNLELYRRDFEFMMPMIPNDEEDEEHELDISAHTQPEDQEFTGQSEIINGIEVQ